MPLYDKPKPATQGVRDRKHRGEGEFINFTQRFRGTNNITFRDLIEVTKSSEDLLVFYLRLYDEINRHPNNSRLIVRKAIDTSRQNSTSKRTLSIAKTIENLSEIENNSALIIQNDLLERAGRIISDLQKKATTHYDNSKYITKIGKTIFTGSDFNALAKDILSKHETDYIERKIENLEAQAKALKAKGNSVVANKLIEEADALRNGLSQKVKNDSTEETSESV